MRQAPAHPHSPFLWIIAAAFLLLAAAASAPRLFPAQAPEAMGADLPARFMPVQGSTRTKDLSAGRFLVARRNLPDSNFDDTVILLAMHDRKGSMGLVINRPTRITLSRLFRELKEARDRTDRVYQGGPVARMGVLALLRSEEKLEGAERIFGDVHLVNNRDLLERAVTEGRSAGEMRVFLGYSGWAAGQLEHEMEMGTWFIFNASADLVFDPEPESVWRKLIERTELRIALGRR